MDKDYVFQVWKAAIKRWPVGREQVMAVLEAQKDLKDKKDATIRLLTKRKVG